MMKGIVLSDNRNSTVLPETEHGLSVYLDRGAYKVILDTGASDLCIRNAQKLGLNVETLDYILISHGHADHIGGLTALLEINSKAKVILSPEALSQRFFSNRKSLREIGIQLLADQYPGRFVFVNEDIFIEPDFQIIKPQKLGFPLPKGNRHLFKDSGKGMEPDDLNHELMACFGTEESFVYCGCAHHGLLNILQSISNKTNKSIRAVLGGFHLLDSDEHNTYEIEKELADLAEFLKTMYPDTRFYTGHCTGSEVYAFLKQKLGAQLELFHTGYEIELTI
ncbi:MAG: MBL fold metallo-hydrolase [Bacteroidales bacterium]